jgi:hypothetical protein
MMEGTIKGVGKKKEADAEASLYWGRIAMCNQVIGINRTLSIFRATQSSSVTAITLGN